MKIGVKQAVPPGMYSARFDGVTATEHDDYGAGLLWTWTIASGTLAGQQVFRTTKPVASSANSCGKFLVAITGLPLEQAAGVDLDGFIGASHLVIVGASQGGGARVESFGAAPAQQPAAVQHPAPVTAPAATAQQQDMALTGPTDAPDF